ncbi:MAG: potassium-transporting ATPase subunit KdpA [Clostridium sp.]|nr:potassium-transporting ATPase subunit KdpA [Clostridium sp.]
MDILGIAIILIVFVLLSIPIGKYIYKVSERKKTFIDPVANKIDNFIYKIAGIKDEEMNWKKYLIALISSNAVILFIAYLVLRIQGFIHILNPNNIGNMPQDLTFNTVISFLTNTNLQNYSGESGLSYFSQMAVITSFMFLAAATGLAVALAFMRGLAGKKTLGNYYKDYVRIITRILLPASIVLSIFFVAQGVPQTFAGNTTVTTIEGKLQDIPLGPVASLESIKLLGTNGGGFFGANSAHPFENPTPFTNVVENLAFLLLVGGTVVCYGYMLKNKKQARAIFAAMGILLLVGLIVCYKAEMAGNPALAKLGLSQSMGNMEGKELRFGVPLSSLFATTTTATATGAVNSMHDSFTPLGGAVLMFNMMLNCIFGGKGVGFMNMIMYAILTVFIAGLMVGRTPEFLSKKIEAKEMKLVALAIIIHPFLILTFSALAFVVPQGIGAIGNSGFHGLSEIIYQYTTSAANNGSSFQGLGTDTVFWNTTSGIVMFFGRYMSMIILMAVAGSLSAKKAIPESVGTFKTDNSMFTAILIAIVIIIGALTFLPAIALGPIAEHLTLMN